MRRQQGQMLTALLHPARWDVVATIEWSKTLHTGAFEKHPTIAGATTYRAVEGPETATLQVTDEIAASLRLKPKPLSVQGWLHVVLRCSQWEFLAKRSSAHAPGSEDPDVTHRSPAA